MIAKPTERPGQAPPRSAHPRSESRLAGLLPRTAHRRPHCRHRRGATSLAEPAWAGFRTLCVTDVLPETATVSSIHLVARTGARSHPPGPDGT
jgi:hypothetical protein